MCLPSLIIELYLYGSGSKSGSYTCGCTRSAIQMSAIIKRTRENSLRQEKFVVLAKKRWKVAGNSRRVMHIYVAGINEKLQTALPTERAIYKSNKISADKPLKSYFGSTLERMEKYLEITAFLRQCCSTTIHSKRHSNSRKSFSRRDREKLFPTRSLLRSVLPKVDVTSDFRDSRRNLYGINDTEISLLRPSIEYFFPSWCF